MRNRPFAVAGAVLLVHLAWVALLLGRGFELRDFIGLGRIFSSRAAAASPVKVDPAYHYTPNGIGYDGQWSYYIAADPPGAWPTLDGPSYRYGRILYPMAARGLALGRVALLPLTLVVVNLVAAAMGTLALAAWLSRRGINPWFAAVFGLNPGVVMALHRDLTEALAYSLVAAGLFFVDLEGWGPLLAGSAALGMAVLSRETTALFVVAAALAQPRRGRGRALAVVALGLLPYLAWDAYVFHWFGRIDPGQASHFNVLPFAGFWQARPWRAGHVRVVVGVILPALACLGMAAWAAWRRTADAMILALAANVVILVVFLPTQSYVDPDAPMRITLGIPLAAILSLPAIRAAGIDRRWVYACCIAWLAGLPLLLALNLHDSPAGLIRV